MSPTGTKQTRFDLPGSANAGTPTEKQRVSDPPKSLTNVEVVQMVKAGFRESVIIKAIEANETAFDISPQALIDLKNAGVSQDIIEVMLLSEGKKRQ